MKVGILGAGFVGSTTAYTLVLKSLASEIVLIDLNEAKAEAEALDVLHAAALNSPCKVHKGTFADLHNSDVVIISVDAQKPLSSDAFDILDSNKAIMKKIVPEIVKHAPNCIILVATNPADIITKIVLDFSQFPKERVIGAGTVLDSARFRAILAEELNVAPHSIHAYVMGGLGSSALPSWSTATIGGEKILSYAARIGKPISEERQKEIAEEVVASSSRINRSKKSTYYGISASLTKIIEAIAKNQRADLTVSTLQEDIYGVKNICLSLPTIIDRTGAHQSLLPDLSGEEAWALKNSALAAEKLSKI